MNDSWESSFPSYVWSFEGLAGRGRRVHQLGQHGPQEALQDRHQPVSRSQAAGWWKVDEGRSPLTMIEWAVISKITQIPEEERRHGSLHFLQSTWMQHCTSHIPPGVSGIKDVHSCPFQLLPDGPHVNERVQFVRSSFHAAEPPRTEAAHVSISVTNVLPCLFQDDPTGSRGNTHMHRKLEHTHTHTQGMSEKFIWLLHQRCTKY